MSERRTTACCDQFKIPSSSDSEGTTFSSTSSNSDDDTHPLGRISSPSTNYLVHAFIGEGTFGKVAKCFKESTQEIVAVKICKRGQMTKEAKNEINILKKLCNFDADKYNFVKCNDAFVYQKHVCIEFERLDMSLLDLMNRIPEGSFSIMEIRPILQQVAVTLIFLQNQRLVHTDLKPDNIMLVNQTKQPFKVKVIDFGLTCVAPDTKDACSLQALCYRSPEAILGLCYVEAIDMWSLGCVAAELFLGDILFPGSCEYDMLQHIISARGDLPQNILKVGRKTKTFYHRKKVKRRGRRRHWVLKDPRQCGQRTTTEFNPKKLDDLLNFKPPCHPTDEENNAEFCDRKAFVELLKQILHVDPHSRITPTNLLEDAFITMKHLKDHYPNSDYFKSSHERMNVCEDYERCVPSKEIDPDCQTQWEPNLIVKVASPIVCSLSFTKKNKAVPKWHLNSDDLKSTTSSSELIESTSPEVFSSSGSESEKESSCGSLESLLQHRRLRFFTTLSEDIVFDEGLAKTDESGSTCSTVVYQVQRKRTRATFKDTPSKSSSSEGSAPIKKRRRIMISDDSPETSDSEDQIKPEKTNMDSAKTPFTKASLEKSIHSMMTRQREKEFTISKAVSELGSQLLEENVTSCCLVDGNPQSTRSTFTAVLSNSSFCTNLMISGSSRKRVMIPPVPADTNPQTQIRPQRKRKWDEANAQPEIRHPESNSTEASPVFVPKQDQPRKIIPEGNRKRTWRMFAVDQFGHSTNNGSPENKRRKISSINVFQDHSEETGQTSNHLCLKRKIDTSNKHDDQPKTKISRPNFLEEEANDGIETTNGEGSCAQFNSEL